jgi:hypothetical protein
MFPSPVGAMSQVRYSNSKAYGAIDVNRCSVIFSLGQKANRGELDGRKTRDDQPEAQRR